MTNKDQQLNIRQLSLFLQPIMNISPLIIAQHLSFFRWFFVIKKDRILDVNKHHSNLSEHHTIMVPLRVGLCFIREENVLVFVIHFVCSLHDKSFFRIFFIMLKTFSLCYICTCYIFMYMFNKIFV